MMTDAQKDRIRKLRENGASYSEIATDMRIPANTIKTYCRRNGLIGDLCKPEPPKKSRNCRKYHLIDVGDRGNSTSPETSGNVENPEDSCNCIAVGITVSFADDPDETAIKDVMDMLSAADYSERGDEKNDSGTETAN